MKGVKKKIVSEKERQWGMIENQIKKGGCKNLDKYVEAATRPGLDQSGACKKKRIERTRLRTQLHESVKSSARECPKWPCPIGKRRAK